MCRSCACCSRHRCPSSGSRARRMASGGPTAAIWAAPATRRSIRSTRATSTSWKWPGGSRPTTSARGRNSSTKATPLMANGVLYATAGSRRAVVALDAGNRRTALDAQRARGRARRRGAAAVVGPRPGVLDRRPRGAHSLRDARLSPHRAECKDRRPGRRLRQQRRRRSEAGRRPGHRSDDRRNRAACDAHGGQKRRHRRRRRQDRRKPQELSKREGLRSRIRRQDRQAPLDLPHHSGAGRVRQRHLGKGLVGLHGQHRRLGADIRR